MLRALLRMIFNRRLPSASILSGYSSISTRENPSMARKRPAHVVGNRVGERFEFLDHHFELRRALLDALLQFAVQTLNLFRLRLDFLQGILSFAVEARVVDAESGAPGQFFREIQIVFRIAARRILRSKCDCAKVRPRATSGYHHGRSQSQFLEDFEMFRILSQSNQHGIRNIGIDLRLAGSHDVGDAMRRGGIGRELSLKFARPFGALRIAMTSATR